MKTRLVTSLRRRPFAILALIGATALCPASRAEGGENLWGTLLRRDAQVITVTDRTPEGRLIREPSRAHPMYYEALVLGLTDYGRSVANLIPPPKRDMVKLIVKLLGDQGYYPATPSHPPEILIAFSWGTMNGKSGMALAFMGGEKLDVMWELEPLSIHTAARARTRHIRSQTADFVVDSMQSDLYVISIQAYDEKEAVGGRTKLLWHTKVSCPSQGLDFTPTLKQMAREAAPFIGRETDKPRWTIAPVREGRVDLGELKALETINPDKLPITDVDEGPDGIGAKK